MIRLEATLADFAPLAGPQCYSRLRVRLPVPKRRSPSCVESTGTRFMLLSGTRDTIPRTHKTWPKFVPLNTESAEDRYPLGALDLLTAEKIFDARWAMTLLDEAMGRLRQECAIQGKTCIFETLKPFLDPINSKAALSYEQVADALQVSVGSVKTLIHRLRKQYAALLREEVSRTVCEPGEVDEEIHSLCEALIAAEGRLGP